MSIEEILAAMQAVIDGAQGRSLTDDEVSQYEALERDLQAAQRDQQIRARNTAYNTVVPPAGVGIGEPGDGRPANPLAYTPHTVQAVTAALRTRTRGRFEHNLTREGFEAQMAALTTGTYGQPTEWGANDGWAGPRVLHVLARVPQIRGLGAVLAEFPEFTLPTAQAAAAEGADLAEYATSAGGTATLGRFGRFTDFTKESQIGTSAAPVLRMHSLGIALDLDDALITGVEAASGGPASFDDPEADVKTAIAKVLAATAAENPEELVLLVNPDNAALFQDVNPIGGQTIAERFQRFAGALVYPSNSVTTGLVTVANLQVGALYFEAIGAQTATDEDVKSGVQTVATALIGGYGITLTAGFAEQVDVVA